MKILPINFSAKAEKKGKEQSLIGGMLVMSLSHMHSTFLLANNPYCDNSQPKCFRKYLYFPQNLLEDIKIE